MEHLGFLSDIAEYISLYRMEHVVKNIEELGWLVSLLTKK